MDCATVIAPVGSGAFCTAAGPAFTARMAVATIASDEAARVLVVTADGPSFCAGADLVDLFGEAPNQTIDQIRNAST